MRKAYLFVYNNSFGTVDEIRYFIDKSPLIYTWRIELPNSFFLISEADSAALTAHLRSFSGEKGAFIVTEITNNYFGWLDPRSWRLVSDKKLPPKEE